MRSPPPARGVAVRLCRTFSTLVIAVFSACVGGDDFVGPHFQAQLGIVTSFPTTTADLNAVDRVVARAVAPPNLTVGRFERTVSADEDEIEIVLDIDLAAVTGVLRIEVELIAGGVVVYAGQSSGAVSDVEGRAWAVDLEPAVPVLEISTDELLIAAEGGRPADGGLVRVRNRGVGTLEWTAASSVEWVAVEKEAEGFRVVADPAGLPAGRWETAVQVTSPRALAAPQTVRVVLDVAPPSATATSRLVVSGGGEGSGRVVSEPSGITCSLHEGSEAGRCEGDFLAGTEVLLQATPMGSSVFKGWTGDCEGVGPCRVRLDEKRAVRAEWGLKDEEAAALKPVVPSRASIQVEAFSGGERKAAVVSIQNPNNERVSWSTQSEVSWLRLAPRAGSLAAGETEALALEVRADGLEVGSYSADLTISTSVGSESAERVRVPIELVVREVPVKGALSVSRAELRFESSLRKGVRPRHDDVDLENPGGEALRWRAEIDAAWIALSSTEGVLAPGEQARLRFVVDPEGLAAGSVESRVRFVALNEAGETDPSVEPKHVLVRLEVAEEEVWSAVLSRTAFGAVEGVNAVAGSGAVRITNQGDTQDVRWQLASSEKWVVVDRRAGLLAPGGTVDAPFTVTGAGLSVGTHTAEIRVRSLGPEAREEVLVVTLVVSPAGSP